MGEGTSVRSLGKWEGEGMDVERTRGKLLASVKGTLS